MDELLKSVPEHGQSIVDDNAATTVSAHATATLPRKQDSIFNMLSEILLNFVDNMSKEKIHAVNSIFAVNSSLANDSIPSISALGSYRPYTVSQQKSTYFVNYNEQLAQICNDLHEM